MVLVSLGDLNLNTGGLPVPYAPFSYNRRRAYGLELRFTSADFNNIFSTVRLRARLEPSNDPIVLDWRAFSFEIIPDNAFFFYPLNRLIESNGDCVFQAERIPIWRGAGDNEPVSLELLYNDDTDIGSWID